MHRNPQTPSATVRVNAAAHATLRQLARSRRQSMQAVLEQAVEEYRRRHFLEEVNRAYGALRAQDDAWAELKGDREAWDPALGDGLAADEHWANQRAVHRARKPARRK